MTMVDYVVVGHFRTRDGIVHLMVGKQEHTGLLCRYNDGGGKLYGMYVGEDEVTCTVCKGEHE